MWKQAMWKQIVAVAVLAVTSLTVAGAAEAEDEPIRVLVYSAVYSFRHDSVQPVEDKLVGLDGDEFAVTATADAGAITADVLDDVDVIVFNNSCGFQPWSEQQRSDLLAWLDAGGGVVAIHCADDANYDWAPYGRMIGAVFFQHPHTGDARNVVEDPENPLVAHLPGDFTLNDEYRQYQHDPSRNVHLLTSIDTTTMGVNGAQYGAASYPQTWCHEVYGARVFATGLGHNAATWDHAELWVMLQQAVRWTGGRLEADCSPADPVPAGRLEAEFADTMGGGQVSTHTTVGGQATVSHLIHGDHLRFADVDLTGVAKLVVNVSPETPTQPGTFRPHTALPALGGTIEVFVGDPFINAGCGMAGPCTRTPDATLAVPAGPPGFAELSTALSDVEGVHDLYLIVREPIGEAYQFGRIVAPDLSDRLHTMSIDWAEPR
jgi:type 1 glutamine amidotransferase